METNNTTNRRSDDTLSSSFDSLSISDLDSFSLLSPSSTLNFPKYPSRPKMAAFAFNNGTTRHQHHFLDSCHLCKKPIGGGRDIFMYRGDTPFCSEECRQEQIEIDNVDEKRVSRSKKEQKSMV